MHACSNCRRHIREDVCPFCHAAQAEDDSTQPPRGLGSTRLRRTALVASVVAMSACAPSVTPLYGIPVDSATSDTAGDDASSDATTDTPSDMPMLNDIAVYGIPPDAGPDSNDMPPYGVPPEDAGND
jgi:hypothetical protein